ncbi:hypothetical protein [Tardiphaga sp. P9-11]|uniref:hypothetical protein n=1 Tax=Tardiphaga sp. P9-11 TaxID=2024614 RepID=UPI0011F36A93|nr:hypothetical protein [Tardiphaga sp. P9-11]KAA0078145.1 hypothetical protein CIW50_03760 [Tardiphaga sp. P9-11]
MNTPSDIVAGPVGLPQLSRDGKTLIVSIPIALTRQGGQKRVVTPDAEPWTRARRVDSTIVKALIRAHRWRHMLESQKFSTVRELAKAEKINESYLCRTLRLTLLSPALIEALLDGRQSQSLSLSQLLKVLPSIWDKQEAALAE